MGMNCLPGYPRANGRAWKRNSQALIARPDLRDRESAGFAARRARRGSQDQRCASAVSHPFPMVYLSVERFDLRAAEFLTVLQPATYDIISKFTRERIARPDCPGEAPTGDVLHSVEVADHDNEATRICILPQRTACEYLSGVVKLRGMDWAAKELA